MSRVTLEGRGRAAAPVAAAVAAPVAAGGGRLYDSRFRFFRITLPEAPVRLSRLSCLSVVLTVAVAAAARAQSAYDSTALAALQWREIGIFRGGRSVAGIARAACSRRASPDGR